METLPCTQKVQTDTFVHIFLFKSRSQLSHWLNPSTMPVLLSLSVLLYAGI